MSGNPTTTSRSAPPSAPGSRPAPRQRCRPGRGRSCAPRTPPASCILHPASSAPSAARVPPTYLNTPNTPRPSRTRDGHRHTLEPAMERNRRDRSGPGGTTITLQTAGSLAWVTHPRYAPCGGSSCSVVGLRTGTVRCYRRMALRGSRTVCLAIRRRAPPPSASSGGAVGGSCPGRAGTLGVPDESRRGREVSAGPFHATGRPRPTYGRIPSGASHRRGAGVVMGETAVVSQELPTGPRPAWSWQKLG